LVYDKFGNYVIQKYIEIGSEKQKETIYHLVRRELLFVSLHSYGCRVIQKLVEYAADKQEIQGEIMRELEPHLFQIIVNQNGNHIIQRVLELFELAPTQTLSDIVFVNVFACLFSYRRWPSIPSAVGWCRSTWRTVGTSRRGCG
jgi:hypothetical protein